MTVLQENSGNSWCPLLGLSLNDEEFIKTKLNDLLTYVDLET